MNLKLPYSEGKCQVKSNLITQAQIMFDPIGCLKVNQKVFEKRMLSKAGKISFCQKLCKMSSAQKM